MPQPVTSLLRQSLMLKAAAAACLDKPKPKPVHQLRSATRRIEATLELLALSGETSDLKRRSKSLRTSLRTIRRAAGSVRDLDVHRELLEAYRKAGAIATLEKKLSAARDKAARKLQKKLEKNLHRIEDALDKLEIALQPALDLEVSGDELARIARRWFAEAVRDLDLQHDDDLHSVRKACKTGRYLAEIGGDASKVAARVATRFESAQEALGAWHDHLLLLSEARASLGDESKVIAEIEADTRRLRERGGSITRRLVSAA
jgi:CHAD domain-containing protein